MTLVEPVKDYIMGFAKIRRASSVETICRAGTDAKHMCTGGRTRKELVMGSGMNTEQAKEYAKTMTYSEAVSNVRYSKGIKYRKATMIKLRELAEIADRLDAEQTELQSKGKLIYMEDAIQAIKEYLDLCCITEAKFHKGFEDYNGEIAKEIISVIAEPNCSEIPNNYEPKICDFCRYYNNNIPCGSTPSVCKKADKFAKEFIDGSKKSK